MNPKCRSIYFDQWSSYRFGFPSEVKRNRLESEISLRRYGCQRFYFEIHRDWLGDKGFYLDTPTWADLKFSTAFKAAFWLGNSAIHTTFYKEMKLEDCKKLEMTSAQYQRLIKFIDDAMDKNAEGNYINIKTKAVYGKMIPFMKQRKL